MAGRLALVVLLELTAAGCGPLETRLLRPPRVTCQDGQPIRILQAPDCINGICGYSCMPGRWESP